MNTSIIAVLFQEGGKLLSEILRNRPLKRLKVVEQQTVAVEVQPVMEKASSVEAGCIPCSVGHLGTCSALLNEAMRFARKNGIASDEVINRINACTDEISALERIDLRPEMIINLPAWEKELADKALVESRNIRHGLEGVSTVDDLERLAAMTQTSRNEIGRGWFKERLARMPKKEKEELVEKAINKLQET